MASSSIPLLLLLLSISSFSLLTTAQTAPPLASGLSYTFYRSKCPNIESIVRTHLTTAFKSDTTLAGALLRLHFHDCFVQGCDASVLLDGSAAGPSEQTAPPNLTLRKSAFKAINDIRALIDASCGNSAASCADVVALAARDSVALSGGPSYRVPLGRRDGLNFATQNATLASLPAPTSNVSTLMSVLSKINLDTTDLVTLSGGHTIGESHCTSFTSRLYPNQDATMERTFANRLKLTCPGANTVNTTVLDVRSPRRFDNKYYVDLVQKQTLFTSDQDLYSDARTRGVVSSYASNEKLFFRRFAYSMVKMGMLGVLTGNQGEVRANCSARNGGNGGGAAAGEIWSVVDDGEGVSAVF